MSHNKESRGRGEGEERERRARGERDVKIHGSSGVTDKSLVSIESQQKRDWRVNNKLLAVFRSHIWWKNGQNLIHWTQNVWKNTFIYLYFLRHQNKYALNKFISQLLANIIQLISCYQDWFVTRNWNFKQNRNRVWISNE